jgi:hypothetical protein
VQLHIHKHLYQFRDVSELCPDPMRILFYSADPCTGEGEIDGHKTCKEIGRMGSGMVKQAETVRELVAAGAKSLNIIQIHSTGCKIPDLGDFSPLSRR